MKNSGQSHCHRNENNIIKTQPKHNSQTLCIFFSPLNFFELPFSAPFRSNPKFINYMFCSRISCRSRVFASSVFFSQSALSIYLAWIPFFDCVRRNDTAFNRTDRRWMGIPLSICSFRFYLQYFNKHRIFLHELDSFCVTITSSRLLLCCAASPLCC